MKKIRLHITEIKNHLYAKIPDIVANKYDIKNNDDIEVTIHGKSDTEQVELWKIHPEDMNEICFEITKEVHTMNMYNRIYVPEKYRFFFPINSNDFILFTNAGNIQTNLSVNGYISKGLRQWFHINGPLIPGDKISIKLIDEDSRHYELLYNKDAK